MRMETPEVCRWPMMPKGKLRNGDERDVEDESDAAAENEMEMRG